MEQTIKPNSEAIYKENSKKIEWQYFDENCKPIHISKVEYKDKQLIQIYPYSYSRSKGLFKRKIKVIELKGWSNIAELPSILRTGGTVRITVGAIKPLMAFLYKAFPEFESLTIEKSGKNRFSNKAITFNFNDFESLLRAINKEKKAHEVRRKTSIAKGLSELTPLVESRKTNLPKGGIEHFLSFYSDDVGLSDGDVKCLFSLLTTSSASKISVTENFIQTKNKINVAYLDDVISNFENLIQVKSENEKDWQVFFEKHGWILANLFPFRVILHKREAYVGGKTLENTEGRVVDFLFQNGFKDNYALLEIKTHNKGIMKAKPYRGVDVYAIDEELAGAISQCLDQKHTFLTSFGQTYKVLDPKVILISGMKSKLSAGQVSCFELLRSNQKNVDIVTFDELLEKIKGLRDVLHK